MMKICGLCEIAKELDEFFKDAQGKQGRRARCKSCELASKKQKYLDNIEYMRLRSKKWRDHNPNKLRIYRKRSALKKKRWMRNRYKSDEVYREIMIKRAQEYRNNPKNKEKLTVTRRNGRKKYLLDSRNRMLINLKRKMLLALEGKRKAEFSRNLIGCTREELIVHLTNQFQEGMSWDNYGLKGWVIDHIIPCCSFDLTSVEEQRKCFHFSNLRPLWMKENAKKAAKDKLLKFSNKVIDENNVGL